MDFQDETHSDLSAGATTQMTGLHHDALLAIADVLDLQGLDRLSCCSNQIYDHLQPYLEKALPDRLEHVKVHQYPDERNSHDTKWHHIYSTSQLLSLIRLVQNRRLIGQYVHVIVGRAEASNRSASDSPKALQAMFDALGIGTQLRHDGFLQVTAEGVERFATAREYFDLAFMVLISLCPHLRKIDLDLYYLDEGLSVHDHTTAGLPILTHARTATPHLLHDRVELKEISLASWTYGDKLETLHSALHMLAVEKGSARAIMGFPEDWMIDWRNSKLQMLHHSDILPKKLAMLANGMPLGCALVYEDMWSSESAEFDRDYIDVCRSQLNPDAGYKITVAMGLDELFCVRIEETHLVLKDSGM